MTHHTPAPKLHTHVTLCALNSVLGQQDDRQKWLDERKSAFDDFFYHSLPDLVPGSGASDVLWKLIHAFVENVAPSRTAFAQLSARAAEIATSNLEVQHTQEHHKFRQEQLYVDRSLTTMPGSAAIDPDGLLREPRGGLKLSLICGRQSLRFTEWSCGTVRSA